jgi:hypothetical protein
MPCDAPPAATQPAAQIQTANAIKEQENERIAFGLSSIVESRFPGFDSTD